MDSHSNILVFAFFVFYIVLTEALNTNHSINTNIKQTISSELDEIGRSVSLPPVASVSSDSLWPQYFESRNRPLQRLLSSVTFVCNGRFEGYYADTGFGCQTFHYCKQNGLRFTFVCPSTAIFNQKELTCDHNVSEPEMVCRQSPDYYNMNALLYTQNKNSLNDSRMTSFETMFANQNSFNNRPSVQYVKTRAPIAPIKTNSIQRSQVKTHSNQSNTNQDWLPLASVSVAVHNRSSKSNISQSIANKESLNTTGITIGFNSTDSSKLSTTETNRTRGQSQNSIDWDDEPDVKSEVPSQPLEPNFISPTKSTNVLKSPIPLPIHPVPLMNSGPIFVLKPDRIRNSSPISDILKQTKYSFENPPNFQNGLHFGTPLVTSHAMIGPQIMAPPMSLIPFTSDLYPKIYPKNSNLLSNFHNVLTKFAFNDIFSLKTSPKRKGSDSMVRPSKLSFMAMTNKFDSQRNIKPIIKTHPMVATERVSDWNKASNVKTKNNFPLVMRKIILMNGKAIELIEPKLMKLSNDVENTAKTKYSLRMDETIDSKHLLQPSSYPSSQALSTDGDKNKKKKWVESYARIKKKYIEKENKFHKKHNSRSLTKTSNGLKAVE